MNLSTLSDALARTFATLAKSHWPVAAAVRIMMGGGTDKKFGRWV